MLKINRKYNDSFIDKYCTYVVDEIITPRLGKLSAEVRRDIAAVFPPDEIASLLTAEPEALVEKIHCIFSSHPGIAERYCYSYFLDNVAIYDEPDKLKLETAQDADLFDAVVENTLIALRGIPDADDRVLTRHYINALAGNAARYKKRKILCRLANTQRHHSVVTDKIKALFPDWINALEDLFDYHAVADEYGFMITQFLELDICPYCGMEKIQTYQSDEIAIRPDLDHFYPKARFPFLAMSVYNLIPSGVICNQRHKKNHPMLGYLHPFTEGIDEGPLFVFGYVPDSKIEETLNVSLTRQLSDARENNLNIFRIKALYQHDNELKSWFAQTQSIRSLYKEGGRSLTENPLFNFMLNLHLPSTRYAAQKYKVDAINDMFGENLVVTPQPHK